MAAAGRRLRAPPAAAARGQARGRQGGSPTRGPPAGLARAFTALIGLNEELLAGALQDYLESAEPSVFKAAAVEASLRGPVRTRGHWPRRPKETEEQPPATFP